jgi:uncharacterized OB-fold protein
MAGTDKAELPERLVERPLPTADDPDLVRLWQGTLEHELRFPACDDCGAVIWYPRAHCPSCSSLSVSWQTLPVDAVGTVYTFTVVRRHGHPFFAARTPYVVAWIDIDDGPRILTEVVEVDADEVKVGDRVVLRWEDHDDLNLPVFAPA